MQLLRQKKIKAENKLHVQGFSFLITDCVNNFFKQIIIIIVEIIAQGRIRSFDKHQREGISARVYSYFFVRTQYVFWRYINIVGLIYNKVHENTAHRHFFN